MGPFLMKSALKVTNSNVGVKTIFRLRRAFVLALKFRRPETSFFTTTPLLIGSINQKIQ
jgi:hypothetical protein